MRWPLRGIALTAGIASAALGLAWVAAAPPDEPIVLSFRQTPLFLGPHEHSVAAISFSPDGKTLATGSADGYLRLWDAATGRLRSIAGLDETRGVHGVTFSPDGALVAAVGGFFGKDALLCDARSGQIREIFDDPAGGSTANLPFIYKGRPIDFRVHTAVAFSPDGRWLATAPDAVVLREVSSGKIVTTLKQPAKGVKAIAFSPDGKTLATAADDKKVRLWSLSDGTLEATLTGTTQPLSALAYSADGTQLVAAGSGNRTILDQTPAGYLWCWQQPFAAARKIELGKVQVGQVAFASPSSVVVAAGRDVLAIDLQGSSSGEPRKLVSLSTDVTAVAVSPDRILLACGGRDRSVDAVELSSGKLMYRLPGLIDQISSVAVSTDGSRFAAATIDRRLTNQMSSPDVPMAGRYQSFFAEDSNASRAEPSEVRIWSAGDGRLQRLLPIPICQVTSLDFVPSSSQLIVAGWKPEQGGILALWDADSGRHLADLGTHAAEVLSESVSPDGRTLVSGDAEGNLEWWNLATRAKTRAAKHEHAIEAVKFSKDGKRLAVADSNRTVQLLDAASGTTVRTLKSRATIESLDFSPDGSLLAAGTRAPGLELWDLGAMADSRTLKVDADHLATMPGFVAFSPDGLFVVCGGHGKDIAVFDAAHAKLHCELRGHDHPATTAAFLPDGRLLSGGDERTVRLWDIDARKLLITWLAVPADPAQQWTDQWVGYKPSGEFVSSEPIDRLKGWITGGEKIDVPDDGAHRRRVESLFP